MLDFTQICRQGNKTPRLHKRERRCRADVGASPRLTGQRLLAQRRRVHGGRRRDDVLGRGALSGARQLRQQLRLQRRLRLALSGRRLAGGTETDSSIGLY